MGKNMAVIENGTVSEINWYADRELETETLVETGERPVSIGDTYADGKFYHDGEEVLSELEIVRGQLADAEEALKILGVE